MIHIATVHHKSDKWIDIQLKYIEKYIRQPYRIYAFLNGVKKDYSNKFYFSSKENIESHAKKLNILAKKIIENAKNDDLILFLDGDAFPIQEMDFFLYEKLKEFKVLAIKRSIDFGDCQPHPAFCVSSVGFWKEIKGDWSAGYSWHNSIYDKQNTDPGGNLLKLLSDNNIRWYPLIRTNIKNPHPRWFAVYGNLIYHHGAGFRIPISNVDHNSITSSFNKMERMIDKIRFIRRILYLKAIRKNARLGDSIFKQIVNDYTFYKNL
ncbi:MAG TPA: hypothetical protein DDX39_09185 [Bacteroidales bacterium]|nr:MAG: hypothetical protein A2W98_15090 [Bacteroidetes bacterium GWF2_33_38]OFY91182.1 MAG: hypothetical protein A2236_00695 [Bacteroidetes bacterium RIFOXYA2_FULL_33_7]HBF88802.1 hypothetical protein [Bacteroidales bacterium]